MKHILLLYCWNNTKVWVWAAVWGEQSWAIVWVRKESGWCCWVDVTVSVIKSFGQLRVSDDIGYGHIYSQSDKILVSYGGGLSDIPQFHCLLQRDQRLEHSQFRSGVSDVWYICDYQTQVIHYGGCFYLAQVRCPFPPWSAGGRHQLLFSMLQEQW